jgi:hypothetical protein
VGHLRGEGQCAAKGVGNQVEDAQDEKEKRENDRALEDPRGAAGVLIAQKRPGAKTVAQLDRSREPKPETDFPATTLQHNAHFRDKRCQKRRQRCPKRHLLHRVDHVTVSRFFLSLCKSNATKSAAIPPPTLSFTTFAGPKYRKPKMASHDLRARSFEDGCLCSTLHAPLQLQICMAFLLPAGLFPSAARQSATQLSHTTFSQLSEPNQGSSSTCTLLFHFQLVSLLYIAVLTITSGLSSIHLE